MWSVITENWCLETPPRILFTYQANNGYRASCYELTQCNSEYELVTTKEISAHGTDSFSNRLNINNPCDLRDCCQLHQIRMLHVDNVSESILIHPLLEEYFQKISARLQTGLNAYSKESLLLPIILQEEKTTMNKKE